MLQIGFWDCTLPYLEVAYIQAQMDSHRDFTRLLAFSLSGCKLMGVRTMPVCATLRTAFYVTQIKI